MCDVLNESVKEKIEQMDRMQNSMDGMQRELNKQQGFLTSVLVADKPAPEMMSGEEVQMVESVILDNVQGGLHES